MAQPNESIIQEYLSLMDDQREHVVARLEGITPEQLWQPPAPGEWSIGEILNHTVLVIRSMFPFIAAAWWFRWAGKLLRNTPYKTAMQDPYRKPNYPHWEGFVWTPRYSHKNQVPLSKLVDDMRDLHQVVRDFYAPKDEATLGHIYFALPIFGVFNLIQALRIGIYHDQLHYDDVIQQRKAFHN